MSSSLKRPSGASSLATAVGFALASGLLLTLTSCGDNGGTAQSATTVTIQPTSYVIRDQVTTTTTAVDNTATAEGRSPVEQAYTVQAGDYPVQIATLYDVSLEELSNYNQWESDYSDFPSPGGTVRIPPNAKLVNPDAPETTDAETATTEADEPSDDESSDDESTTSTTLGGPCDPGTYTLEANDYPAGVAQKFDVSVEALNEANAATEGYDGFYVGLEIVIPPPSDCE
jgi:LysM repeat protein